MLERYDFSSFHTMSFFEMSIEIDTCCAKKCKHRKCKLCKHFWSCFGPPLNKHERIRRNDAGETVEKDVTNERRVASRTLCQSSACAIVKHKDLDRSDDDSATEVNLNNKTDSNGTFQCLGSTCKFFKISNKHASWK